MTLRNRILSFIQFRGAKIPEVIEDPSELDWPEGWESLHYDDIPKLTRELNREMCKEHILYSVPVCALGRRKDRDDFIYQIQTEKAKFAFVHLTWRKEKQPSWPYTEVYEKFHECFEE